MDLKTLIAKVLNSIVVKYGGFPKLIIDACKRRDRPYCPNGGTETTAHAIEIGEALVLWEYDANIRAEDRVPDQARFFSDLSWDIPALSQGRPVRYYLNENIGYRGWSRLISLVQSLEVTPGELIRAEEIDLLHSGEV